MPKVLVVDDETHIRELVSLYLRDEGFDIVEKSNGVDALEYAENHPVDLVILDILMPQMDGWVLCAKLREFGDMPILVKPFDPVELVLRVKALLKRYRISTSNIITLGNISLDRSSYQVKYENGKTMTLPMKELELLYKLGSYTGQLFTRDTLIEQIWGIDYEGDERTVDVHIKRLRERFAQCESEFRIVTIRGLGYRLEVYS